ncbi:hypothetical protein BGW42_001275 [Actinomortierella wolfii]|nr:hypothetical protein BGW42_001275 [Actinomortierella wolfii]
MNTTKKLPTSGKKAVWALLTILGLLILAAPSLYDSKNPYDSRQLVSDASVIKIQHTESGTPYSGFVYKSCTETLSFGYTWFSNIFNIVCDRRDRSPLCNFWVKSSSGYTSLGEKSLNLWNYVRHAAANEVAEIVLKIDDDTIIQKHVFDKLIDDFARKPCKLMGVFWGDDNGANGSYFWPLGRLYIFKRSALPPIDSPRWRALDGKFSNAEDVQMGYLLNITDPAYVCKLGMTEYFWHAAYGETDEGWDKRVEIKFRPLTSSCDRGWLFF